MAEDGEDRQASTSAAGEEVPAAAEEEEAATAALAAGVCSFFKRRSGKSNVRKRTLTEEDAEDGDDGSGGGGGGGSAVVRASKAKKVGERGLEASRKADDDGARHERFTFTSDRRVQVSGDSKATATLETETEHDKDARAIRERILKQSAEEGEDGGPDDKTYKGLNAYKDYKAGFRREHTIASEKAGGAHGPLRASTHIRISARFDYQPDLCKDYKETGYCGFGDACKFMHDRGDYKSGWQLDREWDDKEKARKKRMQGEEAEGEIDYRVNPDSDEDEDGIPFACFICREPFTDPVVTKCKHYFCEHCALKHNAKSGKCAACNKPTGGVFNTAHEIIRKQKAAGGRTEGDENHAKRKVESRGQGQEGWLIP